MKQSRLELQNQIYEDMQTTKRLMHPYFARFFATLDLTVGQSYLLLVLDESQPISFKTLADKTYMTPGAMTQLIDSLEKLDYVKRVRGSTDRRIIHIYVTEKGARIIETIHKQRDQLMSKMLEVLTNDELEQMAAIQRKTTIQLENCVKEQSIKKEHA